MRQQDIKAYGTYVRVNKRGTPHLRRVMTVWPTVKKVKIRNDEGKKEEKEIETWLVRFEDMQVFSRSKDIRTIKRSSFAKWAKRKATYEEVMKLKSAQEKANKRRPFLMPSNTRCA